MSIAATLNPSRTRRPTVAPPMPPAAPVTTANRLSAMIRDLSCHYEMLACLYVEITEGQPLPVEIAPDHRALDLAGAVEDLEGLGVAHQPFHLVGARQAV